MQLNILIEVCPLLASHDLLSCKKKACHTHLNIAGARQYVGHGGYPRDGGGLNDSAEGIFVTIEPDLLLPSQNATEERSLLMHAS